MSDRSFAKHLEVALEHAEDEETTVHLRQALQLLDFDGDCSDSYRFREDREKGSRSNSPLGWEIRPP